MQTKIEFLIRKAISADAKTLTKFNCSLAKETEGMVLSVASVKAGVETLLQESTPGFYLVTEHNGKVVGSLMITFEWSDWRNKTFWWIQSVFVREEFRRQGVYRQLYEKVIEMAEADGTVCGLRLYVERQNLTAQKAYAKLGMTEARYKIFESPEIKPFSSKKRRA